MPENCHGCGRFTSDGWQARLHDSYNRDQYVTYGDCCEDSYTDCEYCCEPVRIVREAGHYIGHRRVARNTVSARRFHGARYRRGTMHYETGGHMHERCMEAWEDENYDACAEGECDCCGYGDEYGSSRPAEDTASCRECNTRNTFLDLDTEEFLCECRARKAHADHGHEVHGWPPIAEVPQPDPDHRPHYDATATTWVGSTAHIAMRNMAEIDETLAVSA